MTTTQSSFPAEYRDRDYEEREFHPMAASVLIDQYTEEKVEWVFEDYLPAGGVVILAAKPKVGKTTLAYQLAVKVAKGEAFLERSTVLGSVLILALEEHPRDVRLRLKSLGGGVDNLYVHTGHLEPSAANMAAIGAFVKEHGVKLILVDTLAMFWQMTDENDASVMVKAMKPLITLARRTNAAVLLIHHCRKSEGEDGDDIRGSIALQGAVDVAVSMTKPGGNRRVLKARGRYTETPAELVVELKEGEYFVIDADAQTVAKEEQRLVAALTPEPQDIEALAIAAKVPLKKAYTRMKHLVSLEQARVEGKGVKGDPHRYTVVPVDSLSSTSSSLEGEAKEHVGEAVLV